MISRSRRRSWASRAGTSGRAIRYSVTPPVGQDAGRRFGPGLIDEVARHLVAVLDHDDADEGPVRLDRQVLAPLSLGTAMELLPCGHKAGGALPPG